MKAEQIIKKPIFLTEKASNLRDDEHKYTFEVDLRASKTEIREAIEKLFDVTVKSVNTQVYRGKMKRVGREMLKKQNWKKAIVQLGEDDSIDIFEGV